MTSEIRLMLFKVRLMGVVFSLVERLAVPVQRGVFFFELVRAFLEPLMLVAFALPHMTKCRSVHRRRRRISIFRSHFGPTGL
jgi:hypothetical protein